MFRFPVVSIAWTVLLLWPASASLLAAVDASCLPPSQTVSIDEVALPAGLESPTLHITDSNPVAQVSGYNIYRSPSASATAASWTLIGFNVPDQDAATSGIQWMDPTPGFPATGIYFYLAAAYNGPCDAEGPWNNPTPDDADEDGAVDGADPCPHTPAGAPQYVPGCSASDLLIHPELLVNPVGEKIDAFLTGLGAAVPPDAVLPLLAEAELSLAEVYDEMHAAMPCDAASSFTAAVDFLNDAVTAIEEYLDTLPTDPPAGSPESTGGEDHWPPDEYRQWSGHRFHLELAAMHAQMQADTTMEVCTSQGGAGEADGVVYTVSDGTRYLQVNDQPMVMARDLMTTGAGDLTHGAEVQAFGTYFDGVLVAVQVDTTPSPFPYLGDLTWDNCLRLRILPPQPLPGAPFRQPSWQVHALDGYDLGGNKLELAPGTQLLVEDNGCPGILTGGPQDIKLDYWYEIFLDYQPKQGDPVVDLNIGYAVRGDSPPIHLPEMDPDVQATLSVTRYKNSCVDNGNTLPVYNGQFEQVGTTTWWEDCSPKQEIEPTTDYALRMRDLEDYCIADYDDVVFDLEDDEPSDWREVRVTGVTTNPPLVPGPLTFGAVGDPVINGQPQHEGPIGINQQFAIHNPWGHRHWGHGTDRASGLDWPHVTGSRNGNPFRYPCSVPRLVTDSINFCSGDPQSFYRLPFPGGQWTYVNQGNGDPQRMGPDSHDTWQEFALDLDTLPGGALRAARGGRILMFRDNFALNCKMFVDGECVENNLCQPLSLPDLESYGNYVAIEHQDGSVSWYAHILDGSLAGLSLNQMVRRGDPVGQSGNTGSSCGPHLHFHVTQGGANMWLADTERILYQAFDEQAQSVESCIIPAEGQSYQSTNLP